MSTSLAPTAQPPGDDGVNPPLTTPAVVSVHVPLPSLSPPQQSEGGTSISPSPVVVAAPPSAVVAPPPPPPPTLSPVESQQPPLTPQLPLQPPLTAAPTTPVTEVVPPPLPPPVITAPPTPDTPVTVTQPSPMPPVTSPISRPVTAKPGPSEPSPRSSPMPIPAVRQAKPGPAATKLGPLEPAPHSPPQLATPFPAVKQAKPGPAVTKPGPLEPGPHSPQQLTTPFPAVRQRKSGPIATKPGPLKPGPATPPVSMPADTKPRPPVTASAVLPTQPPVALPVPQTPRGGAWFPATSAAPPSELPVIPGTPAVVDTPFFGGGGGAASGGSSSSLSSSAPRGSVSEGGGSNALVVGLVVGGVLLLLIAAVCGIFLIFCRRKHKKFNQHVSEKLHASSFMGIEDKSSLSQYTKPNQYPPDHTTSTQPLSAAKAGPTSGVGTYHSSGTFTYDELAAATSGFSDENLLGQGGFGHVYKGVLPNGKEIAVKQLKMGGDQGEREFRAEVDTISQVHHKHLVSLVGFCISGVERLLVYEFVGNNTLDFHLHGKHEPVMDWPTRVKIAIGSAKGLAYLHEDCSPSIIHRDIKAANILLDFNYEAKVSDFGLAKICSTTNPAVTHITTRVVGTFGYLAPEYASSGKVTDKSDVYSYGVVLLELITGHPPISNFGPATSGSLVNWARPLLAQAIADGNFDSLADSRLQNNYNVDEMLSMVSCAAACVRLSSWRRPRMSQVIRALEGNLSASELDSGIKPGHSSMNFPYENLDFDARNYIDNVKRMALASRYSDNTSDYGLNPSESSTDSTQHII